MANEFIIKNGYRSQGNSQITGSLTVTSGITGSFQGTASFAVSASWAPGGGSVTAFPYTGSALVTGSLGITGSLSVLEAGVNSINSTTYLLRGSNGQSSVDWSNRILVTGTGATVLNWRLGTLSDGSKDSVDWGGRKLLDTGGSTISAHWGNRTLINNAGTTVLDWQNATFTGSMLGTASVAISASLSQTASYALTAVSASWAPGGGGGTPAGANTQIQYNNAGVFGATSSFSFIPSSQGLQHGNSVTASGAYSFARGLSTISPGAYSHAEGNSTNSPGYASHAEGSFTLTNGDYAHAEGTQTSAAGNSSHAEGHSTSATGYASHAEGFNTYTHGVYSHAEGFNTQVGRNNGYLATAAVAGDIVLNSTYGDLTGASLFTPGYIIAVDDSVYDNLHTYVPVSVLSCSFDGTNTHIYTVTAINTTTLIVASLTNQLANTGTYRWGGYAAHAEGNNSIALGLYAHSEGSGLAYGGTSHAEGSAFAFNDGTHAEAASYAYGNYSHAEAQASAFAGYSHAEGASQAGYLALNPQTAITSGVFELNPAYGDLTSIFGAGSFVLIDDGQGEINGTASTFLFEVASSTYNATPATQITLVNTSINTASTKYFIGVYGNALPPGVALSQDGIGTYSHAAGEGTQTIGRASYATGHETRALGWYQSVVGTFNQPISTPGAFIVGDGVDDAILHNLLVAAAGNVTISGSLLMSGSISNFIKGEATINFGAAPGSNYTTTTISTPFVTNNSNIHIYIMSTASADHNAMEHQIFSLYGTVMPDNIIDNTSFDIVALSQLRLDGTFKVRYTINNN